MMNFGSLICGGAAIAMIGSAALAQSVTFVDDDNDIFQDALNAGYQHLDIRSVTVSNDDTWVYFAIQTDGNLDTVTWGKYMIALDTRPGGVDGNGWGRFNINHNADNDFWIGSWADDPAGNGSIAGGELYEYDGAWNLLDSSGQNKLLFSASGDQHASGVQLIQVSIAALGLTIGDTFGFDVMSSGGGNADSGVDHLSVQVPATDWWTNPSTAGTYLQYTLQSSVVIPLPGAAGMALAGMGLIGLRRRR
jgi:hypothetical protein